MQNSDKCVIFCTRFGYGILHTAGCIRSTVYCILHSAHCILHTADCILKIADCILQIVYCLLHTACMHIPRILPAGRINEAIAYTILFLSCSRRSLTALLTNPGDILCSHDGSLIARVGPSIHYIAYSFMS